MADECAASRVEYKYTPIEHAHSIRLLSLHPAISFASPIEVSLQQVSLDACPEFGTLSYTWQTDDEGDSFLSRRLECDGAFIKITANCEAALRRLRRAEQVRVLWVDAVCIDQSDDDEKSLQIPLMRRIYGQATWVGLWLGETSSAVDEETGRPLSELGMSFIHDFAVEIAERRNSGQDVGEGVLYREFIEHRRAFQEHGMAVFSPRVRGLWDILHRRWWGRLWVVQELALSQEAVLMCGGKTESFHNLTVVIEALVRSGQPADEFEFNTSFITSTFHHFYMRDFVKRRQLRSEAPETSTPGEKAFQVLHATRNTRANDPRDKIYGVLGFFGDPESDPENIFPAPDYKKTVAEVYADVARAIVTNTGSLDVLSSCHGFVRSSVPDLPSWAAAWNDTPLEYFDQNRFNAAAGSSVIYDESAESRFLKIKGKRVDSVKSASETPDSLEYSNQMSTQLWRQWSDLAFSLQSYPTGESIAAVFMDTLCWGSNLKHDRLAPGEYQEAFDAWIRILRSTAGLEIAAKDIFEDEAAYIYSRRASYMTWGRVLGTTANSYLALVPISVSVGDEIVIFGGGKVPFVIRAEGDKFKLVGPCYIHGIMDGEAFPKTSNELEWFTLC